MTQKESNSDTKACTMFACFLQSFTSQMCLPRKCFYDVKMIFNLLLWDKEHVILSQQLCMLFVCMLFVCSCKKGFHACCKKCEFIRWWVVYLPIFTLNWPHLLSAAQQTTYVRLFYQKWIPKYTKLGLWMFNPVFLTT